jgi:hypothetical protein
LPRAHATDNQTNARASEISSGEKAGPAAELPAGSCCIAKVRFTYVHGRQVWKAAESQHKINNLAYKVHVELEAKNLTLQQFTQLFTVKTCDRRGHRLYRIEAW